MSMTLKQIQEEIVKNKYAVVEVHDSVCLYLCICGELFETDACYGDNLEYNGNHLVPICPSCGLNPVTGQLGG